MMGWYGYGRSMMGGYGFFPDIFGLLVSLFILIDLILLGIFLWKKIKK